MEPHERVPVIREIVYFLRPLPPRGPLPLACEGALIHEVDEPGRGAADHDRAAGVFLAPSAAG